MSEAARKATPADLGAIDAVLSAQTAETAEQRGGPMFLVAEGAQLQAVSEALVDPNSVAIVGTYDDAVFGVATMRFVTWANGQVVGRIERLVVQAEARKAGIGEAIMNELLAACADRQCSAIESIALPGDRHTKNFFESFGLKARMLTVNRAL